VTANQTGTSPRPTSINRTNHEEPRFEFGRFGVLRSPSPESLEFMLRSQVNLWGFWGWASEKRAVLPRGQSEESKMATRYTGHSFDFEVSPSEVTVAVIQKDRISIDFIEDGETGHLEATYDAADSLYRGNYGYPRPDTNYRAELRLYIATNGDGLLFGRWWWADGTATGYWLFRLSPVLKE